MMTFGGFFKDYPGAKRLFDEPGYKPKIHIGIRKYYGIGNHYWVTVQEEYNPIWDGQGWRVCWDDPLKRRDFTDAFNTKKQAEKWLKEIINSHFKDFQIEIEPYSEWFYKDGD
jgi:hypothetical protein